MSNKTTKIKIALVLFTLLTLTSCIEDLNVKSIKTQQKLKIVQTEYLTFDDYKKRKLNPCDTFSIEVANIYDDINELSPAHLDTALLDNMLQEKGFKTVHSGWGNFEKGPRILSLELSNGQCNCKVYKKYIYLESIGENGQIRNFYKVKEKIVCNAKNNAVE